MPHNIDILVVDDEPDLRTIYELTLLREGYRVDTAENLQQARLCLENKVFGKDTMNPTIVVSGDQQEANISIKSIKAIGNL